MNRPTEIAGRMRGSSRGLWIGMIVLGTLTAGCDPTTSQALMGQILTMAKSAFFDAAAENLLQDQSAAALPTTSIPVIPSPSLSDPSTPSTSAPSISVPSMNIPNFSILSNATPSTSTLGSSGRLSLAP